MSKIFRRPMFRKGGGTNMNGIMSGITNREMHANSDEQGVGGPTFKEQVQNRMDIIQSAVGGNKGLDDPLTQFLLSYGPAIATQKPTGNLLGTIVGAAKGPTENLFKNIREQKKLRTGVALEVLENLNDEDIAPFIQKAKQIAKETGRDYKTVLNQLVETELYRKGKSPTEEKKEKFEISMAGLLEQKDNYGSPFLNTYSAEKVAKALDQVKQGKVEGVSFDDIDLDLPYLRKDIDYTTDEASGQITLSEDDVGTYREGSVIFDYRTNKFFKVNGAQLIPIGA
tara:strand:- start:5166 stop:6014 length:849 start_codon:yes stop_codon:yes gene_type:complete